MSHLRRNIVLNAWDDDDWTAPTTSTPPIIPASSSSSSSITPFHSSNSPILVASATQQPKSFYKPELTILKRASPSSSPDSTPGPSASSGYSNEKERKEKERRERERRYQEAKDRIFAGGQSGTTTPEKKGKKKGTRGSGQNIIPKKSSPPLNAAATPKPSGRSTPKAPLASTGAITGFSLNSGSLSAAPVKARERQEWQLRQVAMDGKMLESQAEAYGFGRDEELLGDKERGLDWDEFRRDRWVGAGGGWEAEAEYDELGGQLGKLDFVEVGESANERLSKRDAVNTVAPVREPRGPDRGGRGFAGRGRGGRGRG